MGTKRTFLQAALIATSLTLVSTTQPAWSNQWSDMFKDLFAPPSSGVTYSDSVSTRESQLTNRIIDAINQNQLNSSESQSLKLQLERVKSMEASYRSQSRGGQLGSIEIASLNAELNKVESSLNQMLSSTYNSSVTTNVIADNSEVRLADLKQRITTNLANGRLTIEEAKKLKDEYDHAVRDRGEFRADGSIDSGEMVRLNSMIDDLKRNIVSQTRDFQAWPGIDGQQVFEAKRIQDGVNSNRITRREYLDLKVEVDRIADSEARARSNGLQLGETIALAIDLTNLDQRIAASINNGTTRDGGYPGGGGWHGGDGSQNDNGSAEFDLRQSNVLRRIDDNAANGRLTSDEAVDLKADYRRLEQLETSYRADGRLTSSELDVLKNGLDSIVVELKDKSGPVAVQYPAIDTKQQALKVRIDEYIAKRRISTIEGPKLLRSLAWIASVEAAFRQSGGRLERAEADKIIGDLDRFSAKVDRIVKTELINRRTSLQTKAAERTASGRLHPRVSRQVNRELERIGIEIQALTANNISQTDSVGQIAESLDRVSTTIRTGVSYDVRGNRQASEWQGDRGQWDGQR
ncbi:MAG: hypothetical protein SGJ27_12205 [Candidatus Melainabacteria bacterium]|nr:hypothetical protein [Candidatus Melainabacteria bacterium]